VSWKSYYYIFVTIAKNFYRYVYDKSDLGFDLVLALVRLNYFPSMDTGTGGSRKAALWPDLATVLQINGPHRGLGLPSSEDAVPKESLL
jgi:hypothetical protein